MSGLTDSTLQSAPAEVPPHRDDVNSFWYPQVTANGMPIVRGYDGDLPDDWRFFPHAGPDVGTHFFLQDERFERVWRRPLEYGRRLLASDAKTVLSPDFSCWREMPLPVQHFQTYRNRWVGALWEAMGLAVVPTVGWSSRFDSFFFDGLPQYSTLAIGTIGLTDAEGRAHFRHGVEEMDAALKPRRLLVYGDARLVPSLSIGEIIHVPYEHWWKDYERGRSDTWYDRRDAGTNRVQRTTSSGVR